MVLLVVDCGTEVIGKYHDGLTELYGAALRGHEAVVRLLVDRGADVNAKDEYGAQHLRKGTRGWCGSGLMVVRTSTGRIMTDGGHCTRQLREGTGRWSGFLKLEERYAKS